MFPCRDQVHLCAQWAPSCSSGLWVEVNVFMWLKDHWGSQVIVLPLNGVHRQKASFSITCSHRPRCQYEKHSLHFAFERLATCHVFLWRANSRRAQNLILPELLLDYHFPGCQWHTVYSVVLTRDAIIRDLSMKITQALVLALPCFRNLQIPPIYPHKSTGAVIYDAAGFSIQSACESFVSTPALIHKHLPRYSSICLQSCNLAPA